MKSCIDFSHRKIPEKQRYDHIPRGWMRKMLVENRENRTSLGYSSEPQRQILKIKSSIGKKFFFKGAKPSPKRININTGTQDTQKKESNMSSQKEDNND